MPTDQRRAHDRLSLSPRPPRNAPLPISPFMPSRESDVRTPSPAVSKDDTFGPHTPIIPEGESIPSASGAGGLHGLGMGIQPSPDPSPEPSPLPLSPLSVELELKPLPPVPVSGLSSGMATSGSARPDSPDDSFSVYSYSHYSQQTHQTHNTAHSYLTHQTSHGRGNRSSWRYESSTAAAIGTARRGRVSAHPPLPDRPYAPPPFPNPEGGPPGYEEHDRPQHPQPPARALSPGTATTLLAEAATHRMSTPAPPSRPRTPDSTGAGTAGGLAPETPLGVHRSRSSAASTPSSIWAPTARSSVGSAAASLARARTMSPETENTRSRAAHPPLAVDTSMQQTQHAHRTSADMLAGTAPRFAFLQEDPVRSLTPASLLGVGVSSYSGSGDARRKSAPTGETITRAAKHLSAPSPSALSAPGPASPGDSEPGSRYGPFAGGPAVAWGRRDSARSIKSGKSSRSGSRSRKARSRHSKGMPPLPSDMGHGDDEDDVDLRVLVRRAAVLERLLRAGKRASNFAGQPQKLNRWSNLSASTRTSGPASRRTSARGGFNGTELRLFTEKGGGAGAVVGGNTGREGSYTPSPPSAYGESAGSHHRSNHSVGSSVRRGMRWLRGRPFGQLGSDDGEVDGDGDGYDQYARDRRHRDGEGENYVDLADSQGDASFESRGSGALTPPRRAFSTSFSRSEQAHAAATAAAAETESQPGAGTGVIVFPELATPPAFEGPRHNGDLCAQSCLPPSMAVPYNPLPVPPAASHASLSDRSRSIHSLRAPKHAGGYDEKAGEKGYSQAGHMHNAYSGATGTGSGNGGTVLMGDVPVCSEHIQPRNARTIKIIVVVVCVIGIILIVGLLAGLLSKRNHQQARRSLERLGLI